VKCCLKVGSVALGDLPAPYLKPKVFGLFFLLFVVGSVRPYTTTSSGLCFGVLFCVSNCLGAQTGCADPHKQNKTIFFELLIKAKAVLQVNGAGKRQTGYQFRVLQ
jgi:hypothetical protein